MPLLAACQKAPPSEATASPAAGVAASAAVLAAPEAPASSAAAAGARPWFEGAWRGTFKAELLRIELPAGGVKEWKQDDGKRASGAGELGISVSADGDVSGAAHGALGDLVVSGRAEGDRVALTLRPTEPAGFHGFALASPSPEGMQGPLTASSGDSLQARQGQVTWSRAP